PLVTERTPLAALLGTVAVTVESFTAVNDAARPLNFTCVVPVKFAPLIVTTVPTGPLDGVKPVIVGAELGLIVVVSVSLLRCPAVTLSGSGCVAEIDAVSVFVPATPGVTVTVTEERGAGGESAHEQVSTPPEGEPQVPPAPVGVAETKPEDAGRVSVSCAFVAFDVE